MKISRREFLHAVPKAALAAGAGCALSGCPTPPFSRVDYRSRVVAVPGTDLWSMAREALEAFGGAGAIVSPGERVLIKPNFGAFGMVNYDSVVAGDSTKPEIVLAVADECLRAGAAEVIIAEGGQALNWDWSKVHTLDGTTNVAEEAARLSALYERPVTLACLNSESPDFDLVPTFTGLRNLHVSSLVTRADKVISIPVIKTHRWTHITGAMKNFVGTTPTSQYGMGIQWRFLLHNAGIEQSFIDIVRTVKPAFTIIDCSICCEGNGPHVMPGYWGTSVDMRSRLGSWLVLASRDLAAADATAARVIGQDVDTITHLAMAYDQGLGQIREELIDLDGPALSSLQVEFLPAEHTVGFGEVLIPGLHLIMK